jgi:hypothetical protein
MTTLPICNYISCVSLLLNSRDVGNIHQTEALPAGLRLSLVTTSL